MWIEQFSQEYRLERWPPSCPLLFTRVVGWEVPLVEDGGDVPSPGVSVGKAVQQGVSGGGGEWEDSAWEKFEVSVIANKE